MGDRRGEGGQVAAGEDFDQLRLKERKHRHPRFVRTSWEKVDAASLPLRSVCYEVWFQDLLSGAALCLVTPRLKGLRKHSQGT